MINVTQFLSVMPVEFRVRVKIADKELVSLATGSDAPWSGIATGIKTECTKTEFGRTDQEDFRVYVPLASVPGGVPPDNSRIMLMLAGETTFTEWRIHGSRRSAAGVMYFLVGPLNG